MTLVHAREARSVSVGTSGTHQGAALHSRISSVVARRVSGGIADGPCAHAQGYQDRRFFPSGAKRVLWLGMHRLAQAVSPALVRDGARPQSRERFTSPATAVSGAPSTRRAAGPCQGDVIDIAYSHKFQLVAVLSERLEVSVCDAPTADHGHANRTMCEIIWNHGFQ